MWIDISTSKRVRVRVLTTAMIALRPALFACGILATMPTSPGAHAAAHSKALLSAELIADIQLVEDVRLSPDGEWIAYLVKGYEDDGRASRQLWLAAATGEIAVRRLLQDYTAISEPRWSPDGKHLAVFATSLKPSRPRQLLVLDPHAGTAMEAADVSGSELEWLPGGGAVSFVWRDTNLAKKPQSGQPRLLGVPAAGHGSQIWVLELASKQRRAVTRPELNVGRYAWSPDGKAVVAAHTPVDSFLSPQDTISVFAIPGDVPPQRLFEAHDQTIALAWSPDGRTIAWCGREHAADSGQIQLISATGGSPRTVQHDFPGSFEWMGYRPDGRLALGAIVNLRVGLYSLASDGSDLRVEHPPEAQAPGSLGCGSFTTFTVSFNRDGTRVATSASGPRTPAAVVAGPWRGTLEARTQLNPSIARITLGTVEDISWRSFDGLDIHGFLVKPPGFDPAKKYPFVVEVHGGPRRSWWATCHLNEFNWSLWLAHHGFVVLLPNPRGSEGRGAEFVRLNTRDLGGGDWKDVVAGFNHVLSLGFTDRARMGLAGWSYGGFLTAWGITQPDGRVFKAAVVGAGITNWLSREGASTTPGMWPRLHWGDETALWKNPRDFFDRSPIAHLREVRAAVLLIHGDADNKVPPQQAIEFYHGLRALGRPVEAAIYPGEGHGLNNRSHKIDALQRIASWFESHLTATAGSN